MADQNSGPVSWISSWAPHLGSILTGVGALLASVAAFFGAKVIGKKGELAELSDKVAGHGDALKSQGLLIRDIDSRMEALNQQIELVERKMQTMESSQNNTRHEVKLALEDLSQGLDHLGMNVAALRGRVKRIVEDISSSDQE